MSSSTTASPSNFQLIINALADYAEQTGLDLTKNPFADKLQNCNSAEAISELLQDRAKEFKEYRDGNRKLINCLNPLVRFLQTFSDILGGSLVLVSHCKSVQPFWFSFYAPASRYRFHLPRQYSSASTFYSQCVSPLLSSIGPYSYLGQSGSLWHQ
jgi:fungal STAND N-terminal Goodbye domain